MIRRNKLLISLLISVFLFWLLITYRNYFHWDEWAFFSLFKNLPSSFLLKPYGEHFIPLNLLNHYALFKIFGLNYLPFQLMVLFFHVANVLLLYKIIIWETKKIKIAILFGFLFGISSVYMEDLLWSQGISNVASGFFISLSYLLFLYYSRTNKNMTLIASAIFLIISPLFNAIGVLYPFAFVVISWISIKNARAKTTSFFIYLISGFINLIVLLGIAGSNVSHSVIILNPSSVLRSLEFVGFGVIRGNILRFIYPGLHLVKDAQEIKLAFFLLLFIFFMLLAFFVVFNWLKDKNLRGHRLRKIFTMLILVTTGYVAISLGRANFGLSQAGIPRYTYESFFFLLVFVSLLISSYQNKWKYIVIVSAILFSFNLYAILIYQYGFWGKMVARDREFIQNTEYILKNNTNVYDFPTSGFFTILKISDFWYLVPKNKKVKYISPKLFNPNSCKYCSDLNTKLIYEKFTGEYQKKFD